MADSLTVQGIEFRLLHGPGGVTVQATDPLFGGAAELVNRSVSGTVGYRDWMDRLDSEPYIELPAFSYIRTLPSAQVPEEAAMAWRSHATSPLTGEVRHVHLDQGYLVPAESWVPASFLKELFERVLQERLAPEAVWLFRVPALFWKPSPVERSLVEPLERTARQTPDGHVDSLARQLQDVGLFDVVLASERSDALRQWQMPRSLQLQQAGLALVDYLYSPEHRAVRTPPDYLRSVVDSPVALAVFVSDATPWPATQRFQWLANLLRAVDAGEPTPGYEIRHSMLNGKPRIDSISRVDA